MSLEVTSSMEVRVRFVMEAELRAVSMTELCRSYGISRETGYAWRARYASVPIPEYSNVLVVPVEPEARVAEFNHTRIDAVGMLQIVGENDHLDMEYPPAESATACPLASFVRS